MSSRLSISGLNDVRRFRGKQQVTEVPRRAAHAGAGGNCIRDARTSAGKIGGQGSCAASRNNGSCVPGWDAFRCQRQLQLQFRQVGSPSVDPMSFQASRYCSNWDRLDPGVIHRILRCSTIVTGNTYQESSGKCKRRENQCRRQYMKYRDPSRPSRDSGALWVPWPART